MDTLFTHDPGKEQLHYVADGAMVGEKFGDVRRRVTGAVVLGYKSTDSGGQLVTRLNPKDEQVLAAGDELLVLAKHGKCSFQLTPAVSGEVCDGLCPV